MLSSTHVVSSKRYSSSRKRNLKALLAGIAAVPLIGLATRSASATTYYWDSNGTTPGAGTTPNGTWNTSLFWSTDSTGSIATVAWPTTGTNDAVFSAGTDATGSFTVSPAASPAVAVNSITVEEGRVIASGTAVTGLAGGLTINTGATYAMGDSTKIPAASTVHLNGGTWESQVARHRPEHVLERVRKNHHRERRRNAFSLRLPLPTFPFTSRARATGSRGPGP